MNRYVKKREKEELQTLSQDEKERANLAGTIVTIYLKTHVIPEDGYGELFDRFYEKSLTELRMLKELYS